MQKMSHNAPTGCYNCMTTQPYYFDEADDYVADYSAESDVVSGHHRHRVSTAIPRDDVTEIYRRKSIMPTSPVHMVPDQRYQQHQHSYIPEYYYEQQYAPNTQPPQPMQPAPPMASHQTMRRISVVRPYNHQSMSMSVMDPRMAQHQNYYSNALHHQEVSDSMYRSSPHLPPTRRIYTENLVASALSRSAKTSKRFPVTVRTPRYYRRGTSSTLYKRPSALCLPVSSQPDPAIYKRHHRAAAAAAVAKAVPPEPPQQYAAHQVYPSGSADLERVRAVHVHKMDSEGDVDVDQGISCLQGMLSRFEKEVEGELPSKGSKSDIARMAKLLKPRLPPSLKAKQQERLVKLKVYDPATEAGGSNITKLHEGQETTTVEVQEITADSLEKLLNQLQKCELMAGSKENVKEPVCERMARQPTKCDQNLDEASNSETTDNNKDDTAKSSPSFNYHDISRHMDGNHDACHADFQDIQVSPLMSPSRDEPKSMDGLRANTGRSRSMSCYQKSTTPTLDDHCALELHRSKSYIVNLIDRALSKELGTIPAEKCGKNQFEHMNTKRAIDMVNRHACRKIMENDICMEITQTLADSIISSATCPSPKNKSETKSSQVCVCNANEPVYIKQLKQLRWGHLKHIQREVRRLEDLERFLDQCGPSADHSEAGTF